MPVNQRSSGCFSFSAVSLHVPRGVAITTFPVVSVLLVPILVAVCTSRSDSLSVLFISFEIVESAVRLFALTSSGVVDLTDGIRHYT